jgi:hypothetical protein
MVHSVVTATVSDSINFLIKLFVKLKEHRRQKFRLILAYATSSEALK